MSIPLTSIQKHDGPHPQAFTKGATVKPLVANIAEATAKAVGSRLFRNAMLKAAPQPSASDSISNLQVAMQVNYQAMFSDFVALFGAPPVRVTNIAGQYFVWLDEPIVDARAQPIQPESPAERAGDDRELKSYAAITYGLTRYVSDEDVMNENSAVMSVSRATMFVMQACLQQLEFDFYSEISAGQLDNVITGSGNAGANPGNSGTGVTAPWSLKGQTTTANATSLDSDPVRDVLIGGTVVHQNTGGQANLLIISPTTETSLVSHPQIVGRVDRGQTSGAAMPGDGDLERIFRVPRVVVGRARSGTGTYFAGNNAYLLTAPSPKGVGDRSALMTALFGPEGNDMGITVRTWYDEAAAATAIEGRLCYDIVMQDPKGGVRYADIVS